MRIAMVLWVSFHTVFRRRIPLRLFATDEAAIFRELQALSQQIRHHDDLYYNQPDQVVLTDEEYDALVEKERELCLKYPKVLQQLEQSSPLQKSVTRMGRVGITPSQAKQKHIRPMLSLDNVNSQDELVAWIERIRKRIPEEPITILTEPKLDGASLSMRYEPSSVEGTYQLQWAATRGDGKVGQDVTRAVATFAPSLISWKGKGPIEVRGEVVLPADFPNARNAASGFLLRKQFDETEFSQLKFYAYDLVAEDGALSGIEIRESLQEMGFEVPLPYTSTILKGEFHTSAIQNMLNYHEKLRKHREGDIKKDFGDYIMDGCVHKLSEATNKEALGTSTRAPRWAVAHKFPAVYGVTKLRWVDVQVGRTGALTPVAILDPVLIGGVQVRRATLHNFEHAQVTLGGRESVKAGSLVMVERAGDVIPKVSKLVSSPDEGESISLRPPSKCPSCNSDLIADEPTITGSGVVLRCGGPFLNCPPRALAALDHAFSRDALDIKGLSGARLQQLMDLGYVKRPSDLFEIANDPEKLKEIESLNGWGTKSVTNLAEEAKRVAKDGVTLGRFIYSLSIRHVGLHSSSLVASVYTTSFAFIQNLRWCQEGKPNFELLEDENVEKKGIGPVLLRSLRDFASDEDNVKAAERLASAIRVLDHTLTTVSPENADLPLAGLSVVFTGSVTGMTRPAMKQAAIALGATRVASSVSKNTGLLVAGTKAGKKLEEARELNIKVMEADDFIDLATKHNVK